MCSMCGRPIRFIKTKVKDGYICGGCLDRLTPNMYAAKEQYTGPELNEMAAEAERKFREENVSAPRRKEKGDKFEEVRKYKELRDEGIISDEEYEKKRKEILELGDSSE